MHKNIMIIPTSNMSSKHLELYLNADPDKAVIQQYLPHCSPFELRANDKLIGVILLEPLNDHQVEIKNLSVDPQFQHHGYGTILVNFAKRYAKVHGATRLVVGTGSTSVEPLLLYQKCGFRPVSIDHNFFIRNYHLPLYEHGIRLRDMIRLAFNIK